MQALAHRALVALLCLALFGCSAAFAQDKRIALVIGNAKYAAIPLSNPENDAHLIAGNLRKLGFEVAEHVNLNVRDFRRVLREFARRLQEEDSVAVLYYAGHGVQIDGRNFLLPVDINLRDEEEIKDESVDIDELFLSRLDRARSKGRIVILDACRDNPFSTRKTRNIKAAGGLAEMAARGTLIAYASAPGAAAEDGPAGTNSVYSKHLAAEMMTEGIEVEQMFKNVRVKVLRDTNERQVPWVNTSLTMNFSFNPGRGMPPEELAKQERLLRLETELEQTKKALEQARSTAKPDNTNRLEAELERARKALEEARAAPRPAMPVLSSEPPRVPADVGATRIRAEVDTGRSVIAPPPVRPERISPAEKRPTARERGVRCSDLLQRASIGDTLSGDDRVYLQQECR